jgi:hypothetical protein
MRTSLSWVPFIVVGGVFLAVREHPKDELGEHVVQPEDE